MELFFEGNEVFSMEIDPSATVLEMKQKIEKSYGISVSDQTIFFKGKLLHTDLDSHTLNQCKIVNKSRFELYFSLSHYMSQARQQAEQSPAPSTTSVKEAINIEDSPEKNQDSSSNDDHVLHQTEKSLLPSYTLDEIFGTQAATEGNVSIQEPSWRNENLQDWVQRESSSTSNRIGGFLFGEEEDYPLTAEHFANIQSFGYPSTAQEEQNDQDWPVVQTEKTPRTREVTDIPDSPEGSSKKRPKKLLRVMVLSFPIKDTPARKFPVEVDPSDNVEVLRTELAKMQQGSQLLLPEEGYFFIHKTTMLNENQSFRWNHVAQGDTIEIFPGTVTDDHRTNTRT